MPTQSLKALIFTNDPFEPVGVIGLFETEQQKQEILEGFMQYLSQEGGYDNKEIEQAINDLDEINIPLGVAGFYWPNKLKG